MPNSLDPAALGAAVDWGPFKVEWQHLSRFVLYSTSVPNSAEGAAKVAQEIEKVLNVHAPALRAEVAALETACSEMAAALEGTLPFLMDDCRIGREIPGHEKYTSEEQARAALARYRKEEMGD